MVWNLYYIVMNFCSMIVSFKSLRYKRNLTSFYFQIVFHIDVFFSIWQFCREFWGIGSDYNLFFGHTYSLVTRWCGVNKREWHFKFIWNSSDLKVSWDENRKVSSDPNSEEKLTRLDLWNEALDSVFQIQRMFWSALFRVNEYENWLKKETAKTVNGKILIIFSPSLIESTIETF